MVDTQTWVPVTICNGSPQRGNHYHNPNAHLSELKIPASLLAKAIMCASYVCEHFRSWMTNTGLPSHRPLTLQ